MDPVLLSLACNLHSTSPDELTPLSGGHYNAVYQFPQGDKYAVLRIGIEDCPRNQTLGMLEWLHFLKLAGAPIVAPLPSINNHLLESLKHYGKVYILTAYEKAEGTLAENIPPSEWDDKLFQSIGKAAGKLHHLSAGYRPSRPALTRPSWYDGYEIQEATEKLDRSTDPAREKLADLIHELRQLPNSSTVFGLIHGDLHFANFIIQNNEQVSIIDFDDCVYGWFAMDIAMALFDILVLYNPASEEDSQKFAINFLSNYLAGYRPENDLAPFWLSQIPKFLKLKELCIYATLISHPDIALPDTWVGRFMRDRSARIANDSPYVDIDFDSI